MNREEQKKLVEQVMLVLDHLVEDYFLHKPPMVKKSDSLGKGTGWGSGEAKTINFVFQTIKPTRQEIESRVKMLVDLMSEGSGLR